MKVIYNKWHSNYDFVLGEVYEASLYKDGWLLIDGQLYRSECFKTVK